MSTRKAYSVLPGLKEHSLDDNRKQSGLPNDANFLAYGLHLPDPDESLVTFEDTAGMTKKAWAKDPLYALPFDNFAEAYETSRKCRQSIVVGMFDLVYQLYVAGITE